jgi:predicted RNA binding protein YcfA (HicA-like mRNA interferase family)
LRLGFRKARQTGSHERWIHEDGRATTIPVHGGKEIGPPLFHRILKQLGIPAAEFDWLRRTM